MGNLTLPDDEDPPAELSQSFEILSVPPLVFSELRQPEIPVRFRDESGLTCMRVPEAAVNEYHLPPRWKCQIRLAWKVWPMETKAIA